MGNDQAAQIRNLAEHGWYFSTEQYELFANYNDLTQNADKNITMWGHAGQDTFGGLTAEQLVDALIGKGLKTSGHTLIEILGCAPNQTDLPYEMTYVQKVQELLQQRIKRKIQVKSYPMPKVGEDSIDYRFDLIGYFVYIYGSKETLAAIGQSLNTKYNIYGQQNGKTPVQNQQAVYDKFVEYLKTVNQIKYLTDKYSNVRKYLEKPHEVKTHKGTQKNALTKLLLDDVYGQ